MHYPMCKALQETQVIVDSTKSNGVTFTPVFWLAFEELVGQQVFKHIQAVVVFILREKFVSSQLDGEGSDFSGVPIKMLTVNATLRMNIHNLAALFGIYVSSIPINLIYSEITVATGQLKNYYQPQKSRRIVSVTVEGSKVPMYGAGSSLTVSETGIVLPLTLKFEIKSRGNVVRKLVRTKHRKRVSWLLKTNSKSNS
ncbi:hypothetical protein K2173_024449 [Erythroxylum novogranatense]|uniref:Uncharacterized protein n=1 Tax=Erythroxylum novogranatense TaxID=1862640 RepID=A0AAV8SVD3_9ROSI|nr:hypothetical protein K2173_024449 [Erythroxylum novogranatense]